MKRELAPLVMFVYNRLDSVEQTVENLRKNELADQTDLFIFSDAAKKENQEENVKLVREYIHKIDGFNSVHILEAEKNKGLAKSVITGVTEIINERGKVIVVEDDLIAAPQFLSFMNAALDFYESEKRIWSISGYQFPFEMPETYTKQYMRRIVHPVGGGQLGKIAGKQLIGKFRTTTVTNIIW